MLPQIPAERTSRRNREGHCHYCRLTVYASGTPKAVASPDRLSTRDHTVPAIEGGTETVTACALCNSVKNGDPYEVFLLFVETNPSRLTMRRDYRQFRRELMLEAVAEREKDEAPEYRLVQKLPPRQKVTARYTLKDLRGKK